LICTACDMSSGSASCDTLWPPKVAHSASWAALLEREDTLCCVLAQLELQDVAAASVNRTWSRCWATVVSIWRVLRPSPSPRASFEIDGDICEMAASSTTLCVSGSDATSDNAIWILNADLTVRHIVRAGLWRSPLAVSESSVYFQDDRRQDWGSTFINRLELNRLPSHAASAASTSAASSSAASSSAASSSAASATHPASDPASDPASASATAVSAMACVATSAPPLPPPPIDFLDAWREVEGAGEVDVTGDAIVARGNVYEWDSQHAGRWDIQSSPGYYGLSDPGMGSLALAPERGLLFVSLMYQGEPVRVGVLDATTMARRYTFEVFDSLSRHLRLAVAGERLFVCAERKGRPPGEILVLSFTNELLDCLTGNWGAVQSMCAIDEYLYILERADYDRPRQGRRIIVLSLDGRIVQVLRPPSGTEASPWNCLCAFGGRLLVSYLTPRSSPWSSIFAPRSSLFALIPRGKR